HMLAYSFVSEGGGINMGQIDILGLGAGDLSQVPLGIYEKITQTEKPIYVRTLDHPVIEALRSEGVVFSSFDKVYEAHGTFEDVYEEIVSELISHAENQSIIY